MNIKKLLSALVFFTCNLMAENGSVDQYIVRPCCTDAQSYNTWYGNGNSWPNAGSDREWRQDNITPYSFTIYRRSESYPASFADISEQPQISGFERSVYTTPK
jgi:hypothetical protein